MTAGGTSVMTATVAHTAGGARAQGARTHRRRSRPGRGGQRSPLKCSHFSGKRAYGLIAPNSREEKRCFTMHLHLPSPPRSAPDSPRPRPGSGSASPLSPFSFGERGSGPSWQRPPRKLGLSPVQTCGKASPKLPVETEKLNPSLSQRGIHFRQGIGGAQRRAICLLSSKGFLGASEPGSHSHAEVTKPQCPQSQAT